MKEIMAIIRPGKDRTTKEALAKIGCLTCTTFRVYGRGKQRGLTYKSVSGNGAESAGMTPPLVSSTGGGPIAVQSRETGGGVKYLPKKMVYLIVNDRQVRPVIQAILRANQTGQYGDGRIFIADAKEVVRIRTGEKGEVAIR